MLLAIAFYFVSFIASLIRPYWGLVGMVCSVLIRFQDRFPGIVMIKPFALLLLGMIIGCFIHRDKLASQHWKQDKLLIYMLLISIAGLLIRAPGALIAQTWEYITPLSMYFFASRLVHNRKQFIHLFVIMSCCIAYLGYEAIVGVKMNPEYTLHLDPLTKRWQGLGYYANANEFGQLMITTIPFSLAILLIRKNLFLMAASIGMLYIQIYVMAKTGSRTVMSVLGIMFILTFVLRSKGNLFKKGIIGGIMLSFIIGVLSVIPGPVRERLNTIRDAGNDESFQGRVRAWGHGFDMVKWYPITGVGKGQWLNHHGLAPHNSYVQIMAELGPAGIILFIWVLVLSYKETTPFLNPQSTGPPENAEQTSMEAENTPNHTAIEKSVNTEIRTNNLDQEQVANNPIDEADRTVAIAVAVTMSAWLIYIFLGNQGYSVWNYFYIGLCAAMRNMLPAGPFANKGNAS